MAESVSYGEVMAYIIIGSASLLFLLLTLALICNWKLKRTFKSREAARNKPKRAATVKKHSLTPTPRGSLTPTPRNSDSAKHVLPRSLSLPPGLLPPPQKSALKQSPLESTSVEQSLSESCDQPRLLTRSTRATVTFRVSERSEGGGASSGPEVAVDVEDEVESSYENPAFDDGEMTSDEPQIAIQKPAEPTEDTTEQPQVVIEKTAVSEGEPHPSKTVQDELVNETMTNGQ